MVNYFVRTEDLSKVLLKIISMLNENIESRPVWKPTLPTILQKRNYVKGKYDVSFYLHKNGICLPSGSNLKNKQQDLVIDLLEIY